MQYIIAFPILEWHFFKGQNHGQTLFVDEKMISIPCGHGEPRTRVECQEQNGVFSGRWIFGWIFGCPKKKGIHFTPFLGIQLPYN
jgi:hypothetical protein